MCQATMRRFAGRRVAGGIDMEMNEKANQQGDTDRVVDEIP